MLNVTKYKILRAALSALLSVASQLLKISRLFLATWGRKICQAGHLLFSFVFDICVDGGLVKISSRLAADSLFLIDETFLQTTTTVQAETPSAGYKPGSKLDSLNHQTQQTQALLLQQGPPPSLLLKSPPPPDLFIHTQNTSVEQAAIMEMRQMSASGRGGGSVDGDSGSDRLLGMLLLCTHVVCSTCVLLLRRAGTRAVYKKLINQMLLSAILKVGFPWLVQKCLQYKFVY